MQLQISHLTKIYRKNIALNDMSCELSEGIYGLLGPNGAGKSTLMKLLVHNMNPTSGEILYNGTPIGTLKKEYQKHIGYMPQQQELYPFYSGREFLRYMGLLKGMDPKTLDEHIYEIIERVNLRDVLDQKIGTYSGGMRQRLLIAQTFMGDPDIMIFDEPTAGLDPKERIHVRNLIADNAADKIILIATHVVQDIEYIADEIILLRKGVLVHKASPAQLTQKIDGKVYEIVVPNDQVEMYQKQYLVASAIRQADMTHLRIISDNESSCPGTRVHPDLQDVYLYEFGGGD